MRKHLITQITRAEDQHYELRQKNLASTPKYSSNHGANVWLHIALATHSLLNLSRMGALS
jgi:hypothetical protein